MVDAATVISLVGALGIGSVATQYAASGGLRRQTRADVLKALSNAEKARWVGPEPHDPPFSVAIRELQVAALVARVPREAVAHYKVLAYAAFWASGRHREAYPDDEFAGSVDTQFADVVREAADDVNRLVWSPTRSRIGLSRRIAARDAKLEELEGSEARSALWRARRNVPA
jgi:hypothetical protein